MDQHKDKSEKINKIVTLVNESKLSSIKSVVSGIISIINDSRSNAKDLKEIIEIDPPLTARVLSLANSAYYGSREKISDIQQAVIWIGFEALKELALRQKVCKIFDRDESIEGYSRALLWKHCVAVALLGKMIFRREFGEKGDNAYAAGLLHDIGLIAEDQFFHEDFRCILSRSKNEKMTFSKVEYEVFGFNHADVGKAITNDWNLPQEIVMGIGGHTNPNDSAEEFSKIASTLYLAEYLCQENGIGYNDVSLKDKTVFDKCLKRLNLDPYALDMIVGDMEQEILKMEERGFLQHDKV
jgi:putative nucleotidyltransferase with HDIG domain